MKRKLISTGLIIIALAMTASISYAWSDQVQDGEAGYKIGVSVGKALGLPVGGEFDKNLPAPKKLWEIDTSSKPAPSYTKPAPSSSSSSSSSGPVKTISK